MLKIELYCTFLILIIVPGLIQAQSFQTETGHAEFTSSVLHTFGLMNGGIDRFWGLDDGANTRLGLDYGITDKASVGIGRMTFRNVVDLRGKYNILRQTRTGSTPIEVAVKGSVGINTLAGIGWNFEDRVSYLTSVMVARKFNGFSLQLTPMMAHFNRVWSGGGTASTLWTWYSGQCRAQRTFFHKRRIFAGHWRA